MGFRNRKHDDQRSQRTRRATPDASIAAACRDELAVIADWRIEEPATS